VFDLLSSCVALRGISANNLPLARSASAKVIVSRPGSRPLLVDAALAIRSERRSRKQLCKAFRPSSLCHDGGGRLYVDPWWQGDDDAHTGRNHRSRPSWPHARTASPLAGY